MSDTAGSRESEPGAARRMPPFYFMIALLAMAALHFGLPIAQLIASPWNWLGLLPAWASAILVLAAAQTFKRVGTAVRPFETSSTLVTTGVYRLTRNPMYLSMLLLLLGGSIFLGSLTPFLTIPALGITLHYRYIIHEEQMLTETFGQTYTDYQARVRRWF